MRKLSFASLLLLAWQGCTDAQNESISITFDLPTSDQLGTVSSSACTCAPATQAQASYIPSGLLELDPVLNHSAQYTLNLQTENYLDTTQLVDSNGTTISGEQRNDFHVQRAIVNYLDTGGILTPLPQTTILVSADVRPGGLQSSACIPVQAVPNSVATQWFTDMKAQVPPAQSDVVVLEVQLQGVLSSGEPISSGFFHFPITLCTNCAGSAEAGKCLVARTTLVGHGHGPCCAPQDFEVTCDPCGGAGQPCCTTGNSCDTGLVCRVVSSTTIEFCSPYNNALQTACATM